MFITWHSATDDKYKRLFWPILGYQKKNKAIAWLGPLFRQTRIKTHEDYKTIVKHWRRPYIMVRPFDAGWFYEQTECNNEEIEAEGVEITNTLEGEAVILRLKFRCRSMFAYVAHRLNTLGTRSIRK